MSCLQASCRGKFRWSVTANTPPDPGFSSAGQGVRFSPVRNGHKNSFVSALRFVNIFVSSACSLTVKQIEKLSPGRNRKTQIKNKIGFAPGFPFCDQCQVASHCSIGVLFRFPIEVLLTRLRLASGRKMMAQFRIPGEDILCHASRSEKCIFLCRSGAL